MTASPFALKTSSIMRTNKILNMKGERNMSLSTIAAGIVIVGLSALFELTDKDYEAKRKEFENS